MAKILNPSKLLPSSKSSIIKSSTIAKIRKPNILAKTSSLSKGLLATKQSKDASDVNNKLVKIDKFLKSDLIVSQKKAEVKRKGKEKQDFDEAEKKLETPKLKGFKIPSLGLPSLGFFDRVKRFLFFTALGWLLPKIIEFLPKLEGFAKIVGGIYNFAEGLFGNLFNGFMSLVKFGGDLKDKTLGFIASAKAGVGGNYQKEFEKLEKQFNTFANVSIIAGLVGLDMGLAGLDEFNKQKKKGQKPVAGKPKPGGKPKVTTGKGGEKPSGKPKVTTGKGGKSSSWMDKIFKGPFAKLKGPLSRFAGAAVPGLGAVVGAADAKARFAVGDKIGGALASVSAALDAATVASALTGVGIPVAGILGSISIGIDVILLIRDILSLIPFIPKNLLGFSRGGKVVKRYQGGGTTRGGRPVGAPKRRAITPTRRKPPRVTIPKTQPGKDVGGEKKVKEFYAKPEDPNKRYTRPAGGWLANLGKERQDLSAFDTLKKMSGTLKSDETLAKGILGVMSSGIDMALGQKPDKKVFKSFFDSIGYIADTLASQRASKSMSSLRSQIGAFAEGGTIPSRGLRGTYGDANTGDMLAKLIGPTIDQRVNEAIESIEKQLQMKGAGGKKELPQDLDMTPGNIRVTSDSPDFWLLVTAALFENGIPTDGYQGAADAAQAIYNRVSLPGWPKSIKGVILQSGQFQPVRDYGGASEWEKINSKESAISFAKKYKGYSGNIVEKIAAALLDRTKQENARTFVGPRDNFRSDSYEKSNNDLDDSTEKSRYGHTFGFEPRGANIGRFKKGGLMPAEINKEIVSGKVEKLTKQSQSGYKPRSPGNFNAIEYITGDSTQGTNYDEAGHGGLKYHEHIAFQTESDKERAKTSLRAVGFEIGSEYRSGDRGYHGANLAIDVPLYKPSGGGVQKGYSDDSKGEKQFSAEVRKVLGLKGGGLVSPSKPNRSIPNSFASYETPGGGMMIAIQPMIIERQVPVSGGGGKMIAFPVPVAVNSNMDLSLSRG